ncbi:AraC family transcriptional regulator [Aquabacter cavernae]|uniref:AraC family transcriptional regulator n=1 Tax=Aquabacter cavernae TaxID=2496029 RepID=UPI000F8F435A|nr:AraC family transcriptional regulator [Aquabacter cavernae]
MSLDPVLPLVLARTADTPAREGLVITEGNGLNFARADGPTGYLHSIYAPLLCLVLQGAKEVAAGTDNWRFHTGQTLLVSADTPIQGRVVEASGTAPYLAISLNLDLALLRDVLGEISAIAGAPDAPGPRILVSETDAAVADCIRRLVLLPERADAQAVLRPALLKELHYWLLQGRHGPMLRRLARPEGHAQRIARAVAVLRADFARALPVRQLAEAAGMSPSAFHQHFKAVTSLTPLQFQKQLRLIEARHRLMAGGLAVSSAAFDVGYESVSQFSRDYSRMFGASPRQDLTISRQAA